MLHPLHTFFWNVCLFSRAGGEDDFELFLASVKARSLKTTARLREGIYQHEFHHCSWCKRVWFNCFVTGRKIHITTGDIIKCFNCCVFWISGDGQSSNSSGQTTTLSKDRSQADGSSLDLEWEHEDGTFRKSFFRQLIVHLLEHFETGTNGYCKQCLLRKEQLSRLSICLLCDSQGLSWEDTNWFL